MNSIQQLSLELRAGSGQRAAGSGQRAAGSGQRGNLIFE